MGKVTCLIFALCGVLFDASVANPEPKIENSEVLKELGLDLKNEGRIGYKIRKKIHMEKYIWSKSYLEQYFI